MPREKRLNDSETNCVIEDLFTNQINRDSKRYTYIEFAENKQIAIDRFKLKLILLKDQGRSFYKSIGVASDTIETLISYDYLHTFEMVASDCYTEDKELILAKYDPLGSIEDNQKTIEEALQKIKDHTGYGSGIFKEAKNKEFGSKLADALYIFDCRKFDLEYTFIKYQLDKYYPKGQKIKTSTIKQYFEDTYELYKSIDI